MRTVARLVLVCLVGGTALAAADPVLGSSGVSPTHITQRAATPVDPYISLVGTVVPTTILVTVSSGFTDGDVLNCDVGGITGATASFDAPIGVLTLSGATTLADWRTLLRRVTFFATDYGTAARTIVFSQGSLVAGANGHFYGYVPGADTWSAARAAAAGHTHLGVAGYLATVTSGDENGFIRQTLNNVGWIGASDGFSEINGATGTTTFVDQAAAEGHWYWITGPEAGTNFSNGATTPVTVAGRYANWNTGEPNNDLGTEHFASMEIGAGTTGLWNDLPDGGPTGGYVVEYGGLGTDDTVGLTAATVVTVLPDSLPVATWQTVTTLEDTDIVITLAGTDPDGDVLTYTASPALGAGTVYQYDAGVRGAAITTTDTAVTDGSHRLIFAPAADASGAATDNIQFRISDGTLSDVGYVTIDVIALNDAPVWLLDGSPFAGDDHRAGTAGTVEDLGSGLFGIVDVDAGSAVVQVTLSVDHGRLTIPVAGLDFAFTPDADGSPVGAGGTGGTLCFRGTIAAANSALDALTLTHGTGFTGAAHVTLAVSDLGHSGAGGTHVATALYRIDVGAAPKGKSDKKDSWVEKTTGCGAGGGFAAFALVIALMFARRRW